MMDMAAATGGAPEPRDTPAEFQPYRWATPLAEVAARHGLQPAQILRFDGNVPPLPGVPQIPLSESFARLNEYPEGSYRELREAAAGYVGGVDPDCIVIGAGADDLIATVARTYLQPGRRSAIVGPTYPVYRISSLLEGAEVVEVPFAADAAAGAAVLWLCNPNNPTGDKVAPAEVAAVARALPGTVVVVDEAYVEYGGDTVVPLVAELPNLVVLRTLSKAFGLAGLRVGYAVAQPQVAADLTARRGPAPITTPSARIGAAALRDPRTDVAETIAERDRMREALLAAGCDVPPSYANFLFVRLPDAAARADALEAQGLMVRRFPDGIRITPRLPGDNDALLAALGAGAPPPPVKRSALVIRTTTETALRISLQLDGRGRARVATGIGFLDHLLTLMAFQSGADLDLLAGGDLDVDEHHTVEDVLAALGDAYAQALGGRAGVTRYGSAVVPMDEARATVAVDLVKRPHAEISLAFTGDRVGGLALSLLPHALERFTMQAGFTVHVDSAGDDDHHVAEAAFKALGRALRQACEVTSTGVRSTKGEA
jgi:histidinol-phosphate aminotransferase